MNYENGLEEDPMQTLRKIMDKFIGDWLRTVVELDENGQSCWPIANPQGVACEFRVLTPALQRSLDQCARGRA